MSSDYREYPPPAHLRAWVQCLWTLELATAAGRPYRVLPDGCIDILFETAGTGMSEIYVVGMMTRPLLVTKIEAASITAVRFKPGGASAFFREPLHRLTDVRIGLQELWRQADSLRERLSATPVAGERIGLLVGELELRLEEACMRRHVGWRLAIRRLTIEPETGVRDLCAHLGVSRQALARSFREHVGVSPKTLGRVLRLQRALHLIGRERTAGASPRWVDVALEAGYYDQSHLIAEFRDLVGLTPSAFLVESGRGLPVVQDGDAAAVSQ